MRSFQVLDKIMKFYNLKKKILGKYKTKKPRKKPYDGTLEISLYSELIAFHVKGKATTPSCACIEYLRKDIFVHFFPKPGKFMENDGIYHFRKVGTHLLLFSIKA